jgi:hydrogenase nickel incorporation protein HypA/HybF
MHELAVTQSLLDIALRHAAQAGAVRVTDLNLVIGQLSSIVDDSVQFYWDTLCQGTLCQGAQLHFERVPVELQCRDCGTTYGLAGSLTRCPRCRSTRARVTAGEEFHLESIQIETESDLEKAAV